MCIFFRYHKKLRCCLSQLWVFVQKLRTKLFQHKYTIQNVFAYYLYISTLRHLLKMKKVQKNSTNFMKREIWIEMNKKNNIDEHIDEHSYINIQLYENEKCVYVCVFFCHHLLSFYNVRGLLICWIWLKFAVKKWNTTNLKVSYDKVSWKMYH